ncbi:MAG: pyridoxamine 5'-phosphate oxidase [Planctomycetaceae bacterium]|nr:pyridoxamine 5'-phosphate oxidase [Planctomycetaceae bacterium]
MNANKKVERLNSSALSPNPFLTFESWFAAAGEVGIAELNAMGLATSDGIDVSVRMVLMKYWDAEGFVFFTNYGSRKASQIFKNSRVALLFYWEPLHRQVRIEGFAERVSAAESFKYFATRPRGSQLGAWCSEQSTTISSREVLATKLDEVKRKFANREIPLPSMWGGFRVVPTRFEFWQQGDDRLHDRFAYEKSANAAWEIQRLAP